MMATDPHDVNHAIFDYYSNQTHENNPIHIFLNFSYAFYPLFRSGSKKDKTGA